MESNTINSERKNDDLIIITKIEVKQIKKYSLITEDDDLISIPLDYILVWCFKNLDEVYEKIKNTMKLFERSTKSEILSSPSDFRKFISKFGQFMSIVLITSSNYAKLLENEINSNDNILAVFINCFKTDFYEDWMKKNRKIKYLSNSDNEIKKEFISSLLKEYGLNVIKRSDLKRWTSDIFDGIQVGYYFDTKDSCVNYIYLETIYEFMDQDNFNLDQSIQDFLKFCEKYLNGHSDENFDVIKKEIKQKTFETNIIYLYTLNTFFFGMLNNTFRKDNWSDLFELRYPVYLLNKRLKTIKNSVNPKFLYRGTKFNKSEFDVLKSHVGKVLLLRGFNSTSDIKQVPEKYFSKKDKKYLNNGDMLHILMIIFVKDNDLDRVKSIKHLSAIEKENEWLLGYLTFLKVIKLVPSNNQECFDYEIHCELCDFSENIKSFDPTTLQYKETLKKELIGINYEIDKLFLVDILNKTRKDEDALKILKELEKENPNNRNILDRLGSVYYNKGEHDKSIEYCNKSLKIRLNLLGEQHTDVASSYNNLACAHSDKGEYDKAIQYYNKALKIQLFSLGEHHPHVAGSYNNLAIAHRNKREFDKAIEYYNKSLKIQLSSLGEQHPMVAGSYNNLANAHSDLGEYDRAKEYHSKSLKIRLNSLGEQHPNVASSYNNLAIVHSNKGEYHKAIEYYNKSLKIRLITLGEQHPDVASSYNNLACACYIKGEYDKSIEYYNKSMKIYINSLGEHHPYTVSAKKNLELTKKFIK